MRNLLEFIESIKCFCNIHFSNSWARKIFPSSSAFLNLLFQFLICFIMKLFNFLDYVLLNCKNWNFYGNGENRKNCIEWNNWDPESPNILSHTEILGSDYLIFSFDFLYFLLFSYLLIVFLLSFFSHAVPWNPGGKRSLGMQRHS